MEHAPKAIQSLTLSSGGFPDVFHPQLEGVRAIEEMILGSSPRDNSFGCIGRNNQIYLCRRTFTKVSVGRCSLIQRSHPSIGGGWRMFNPISSSGGSEWENP